MNESPYDTAWATTMMSQQYSGANGYVVYPLGQKANEAGHRPGRRLGKTLGGCVASSITVKNLPEGPATFIAGRRKKHGAAPTIFRAGGVSTAAFPCHAKGREGKSWRMVREPPTSAKVTKQNCGGERWSKLWAQRPCKTASPRCTGLPRAKAAGERADRRFSTGRASESDPRRPGRTAYQLEGGPALAPRTIAHLPAKGDDAGRCAPATNRA